MRVLVCGDREWKDREYLYRILDDFRVLYGIDTIIEGEARGADRMAREWSEERSIPFDPFPAHWDQHDAELLDREGFCCTGQGHCKRAGRRRNEQMLSEGKPDMVIAFHRSFQESKGTKHMVEIARAAGVKAHIFPHHTVDFEEMIVWDAA